MNYKNCLLFLIIMINSYPSFAVWMREDRPNKVVEKIGKTRFVIDSDDLNTAQLSAIFADARNFKDQSGLITSAINYASDESKKTFPDVHNFHFDSFSPAQKAAYSVTEELHTTKDYHNHASGPMYEYRDRPYMREHVIMVYAARIFLQRNKNNFEDVKMCLNNNRWSSVEHNSSSDPKPFIKAGVVGLLLAIPIGAYLIKNSTKKKKEDPLINDTK